MTGGTGVGPGIEPGIGIGLINNTDNNNFENVGNVPKPKFQCPINLIMLSVQAKCPSQSFQAKFPKPKSPNKKSQMEGDTHTS